MGIVVTPIVLTTFRYPHNDTRSNNSSILAVTCQIRYPAGQPALPRYLHNRSLILAADYINIKITRIDVKPCRRVVRLVYSECMVPHVPLESNPRTSVVNRPILPYPHLPSSRTMAGFIPAHSRGCMKVYIMIII